MLVQGALWRYVANISLFHFSALDRPGGDQHRYRNRPVRGPAGTALSASPAWTAFALLGGRFPGPGALVVRLVTSRPVRLPLVWTIWY
jgi:hypothetical protein